MGNRKPPSKVVKPWGRVQTSSKSLSAPLPAWVPSLQDPLSTAVSSAAVTSTWVSAPMGCPTFCGARWFLKKAKANDVSFALLGTCGHPAPSNPEPTKVSGLLTWVHFSFYIYITPLLRQLVPPNCFFPFFWPGFKQCCYKYLQHLLLLDEHSYKLKKGILWSDHIKHETMSEAPSCAIFFS